MLPLKDCIAFASVEEVAQGFYLVRRNLKREAEASLFSLFRWSVLLRNDEQRQERKQRQRFDERKAQKQHRKDTSAGSRISRGSFTGCGYRSAIPKRSPERG
jgi:hypothetical protein